MKIGIIADGQAEAQALEYLVAKMRGDRLTPLKPVYADMQPYAPAPQIVKVAESRIHLLSQRGAQRHIVLLDRERVVDCPGVVAARIAGEFARQGFANISVVLKDRAFENWLVAGLRSIARGGHKRIVVNERIVERIHRSGADSVNAAAILDGCIEGGYHKRKDALSICKAVDPDHIAQNSRSFRKFTRVFQGL